MTCGGSPGRPPLLRVRSLVTKFPVRRPLADVLARRPRRWVHAVDGVSFDLEAGQMLALVGQSGCGKTSAARSVLRLVEPASGEIWLEGRDITHLGSRALRPLRGRMQLIFQDPFEALDPRFRARQTLEEPMLVHGLGGGRGQRRALVLAALERVGLTPAEFYADRFPQQMSGGQRQRLAIAASLVLGPRVLVADEPVSMLDVSVRAGVLELLDGLRASHHMAILMITHDLSTAAHYADRIAVMYAGRILEVGPARQVVGQPAHPYTRALLAAVPSRQPGRRVAPQVLAGEPPDPTQAWTGCRFAPRCPHAIAACGHGEPALEPAAGGAPAAGDHRVACIRSGALPPAAAG